MLTSQCVKPDNLMSQYSYGEFRGIYLDKDKGNTYIYITIDKWRNPLGAFRIGKREPSQDFNTYYGNAKIFGYKPRIFVSGICAGGK